MTVSRTHSLLIISPKCWQLHQHATRNVMCTLFMLDASDELSNVPRQPQWTPVSSKDSMYDLSIYVRWCE